MVYAGRGPTVTFLNDSEHPKAGVAVDYDVAAVTAAMLAAADNPLPPAERAELAAWSAKAYSLDTIADRVVDEALAIAGRQRPNRT